MGGPLEAQSSPLTGHVLLELRRPKKILSLTLSLKLKLSNHVHEIWSLKSARKQTIWIGVLLGVEQERSITLPAGAHIFPFEIPLRGDMTETVISSILSVRYNLVAELKVPGIQLNIRTRSHKEITMSRFHVANEIDLLDSVTMRNCWPEYLEYQMMIDRKVATLGQRLPIEFNLWPLFEHVNILGIRFGLLERLNKKKVTLERWYPLMEELVTDPPGSVSKLAYIKIPNQPKIMPDMNNDLITISHQLEIFILFQANSRTKSIVLRCTLIIAPPVETTEDLPSYSQALQSPQVRLP
ncbi:hypothetical protein K493DRAFT_363082 [Basidiobolus meristosporus CBS 931.73]|uniref:Arrestin-like N-terminal domain-containing protein n=1 Tax=Basidiobolus meristosporus CBS 931.73 TaxID=1314790 RepID=A0A1Y1WX89_9FUNG|nr:hypothetical protein K493DRAFT_363082 [Basidiobolus meristosporus CBS 931.73]|eukprot:ORX78133.1 hypothetical protein K493DRAFT_363082 [Basidiobolus meristosporus CBS 931.73]